MKLSCLIPVRAGKAHAHPCNTGQWTFLTELLSHSQAVTYARAEASAGDTS